MSGATIEADVAWLVARTRIADLVYRYAHAARERDMTTFEQLFTEDGLFEIRDRDAGSGEVVTRTRVEGSAAIAEFVGRSLSNPGETLTPLVHDLLVTVTGDTATARCVMVGAEAHGAPRFMGTYADSFRRDGGEWRFTARVFTIAAWKP